MGVLNATFGELFLHFSLFVVCISQYHTELYRRFDSIAIYILHAGNDFTYTFQVLMPFQYYNLQNINLIYLRFNNINFTLLLKSNLSRRFHIIFLLIIFYYY